MPHFITFDDGMSYYPISIIKSFELDRDESNKGGTVITLTDGTKIKSQWSVTKMAEKLGGAYNTHY
jgi:hypothetical protein